MIKVAGHAPCEVADIQADPWIPLTVRWRFAEHAGLLNLYVSGADGGYVEMAIDERSGALVRLVVIEAPPETARHRAVPHGSITPGTVILDREMWQWRTTPDYKEPARRDASIHQDLSWSLQDDSISLLFSSSQPSWLIGSRDAEFAISASGELVRVTVKKPEVELPPGYPG